MTDDNKPAITKAWGAIRPILEDNNTFGDIKRLVGMAGLDVSKLSHLEPKTGMATGHATKTMLMTGIDTEFGKMNQQDRKNFVTFLTEDLLKIGDPSILTQLEKHLSRHGWGCVDSCLVPLELFDPADLVQLPEEPRADLVKASLRFRDGDLGGAISAACGAVDTVTSSIYATYSLGDPTKASCQERCRRAMEKKVLSNIEVQLRDLTWDDAALKPFVENYNGAFNQGAYIRQSLRSKMGDVHGTKPILKPLVFDILKWAELFVCTLSTENFAQVSGKPC